MALRDLPYSEACERNKRPILRELVREFQNAGHVLEIGSGTGQHAEFFAANLPHLEWQPTELVAHIPALEHRLAQSTALNLLPPRPLDVSVNPWATTAMDAIFTANTLHIMSWPSVLRFFAGIGRHLTAPGIVAAYGPFRYKGKHTSESNEAFDAMLRARDPDSGVRDFEALDELARGVGLKAHADHALPANNHLLVWRKLPK